ncbi:MAG: chitobiase/beta-hexosaminidase C-terminal domain-containing protein [Bacteroidaceae bacterium]|nr:chitobiase/beta-hexosaminidase C-terminal domain-containing protein [Bacteroidaceae bacterium]
MKKILLSILCCMLAVLSMQAQETVTDVLSATKFAATGTSYKEFSGVSFTSDAVYAGQSAKTAGGAIQLRSKNSNSGIVTTVSGGKAKSVTIKVESGSNTLDIYGSNTAYTSATDLYGDNKGTKLGSLKADGTLEITGDYEYIGLRSNSGALYLTSISIVWETNGEGGEETPVAPAAPTLPAACYFDDAMTVEITDVAEGATAYYSLNDENNWIEGSSVEITGTTTVYAKVVKDELSSDVVSETYTKLEEGTMMITFATDANDNNTAATTGNFVSDHIKEHNFETTLTCSATNNCYVGKSGLKMGSSSKNGSFTLSLGGGYKVTSIIVRAVKYSSDATSVTVNEATAQTLTTSLADYTFDVNSEISQIKVDMTRRGYIESIMVVCQEGASSPEPVVPNAPVLPASTTFEGSMMVEITGIATDATVYYTTDESDPATSLTSVEYSEPFEITATTTVKAVAINEVGASDIAEATYTLVETITLSNCTVAELIEAYASGNNIAKDATVVGYIVGCVDGSSISNAVFGNEVSTNSNILLADDPYETNIDNCIPVQLPSGNVREALNLVGNSDNYQKKVILTGNVEAYFTVAALKSTSAYEFVEMFYNTLTVTDAGWATLYLAASARIPSTVEAYTVTTVNNGWVSLTQVTGVIPANTGIIVKAAAGDYKFFMGETATADVTGNLLSGSAYNRNIDEEAYVLGKVDGVVGLYKAEMNQMDGTAWLNNANKAYLPASEVPNKSVAFYGFDWDGTTGIDQITDNREQSTVIYDLTGRRVEAITAPGIYIVGGKKVLVR